MAPKFHHVYQFKVTLVEVKPAIWRVIQVPETYTFWDFHVAIQDAMGWLDYHLHEFKIVDPKSGQKVLMGIPEHDFEPIEQETLPGWEFKIRDYFSEENRFCDYLYDFGDNWEHRIEYEGIFFKHETKNYPLCVGGKRCGPPEDCGGWGGYGDFLKIIRNPRHKEYHRMREWAGEKCETEKFDVSAVRFDDPKKRWKLAFRDSR